MGSVAAGILYKKLVGVFCCMIYRLQDGSVSREGNPDHKWTGTICWLTNTAIICCGK